MPESHVVAHALEQVNFSLPVQYISITGLPCYSTCRRHTTMTDGYGELVRFCQRDVGVGDFFL